MGWLPGLGCLRLAGLCGPVGLGSKGWLDWQARGGLGLAVLDWAWLAGLAGLAWFCPFGLDFWGVGLRLLGLARFAGAAPSAQKMPAPKDCFPAALVHAAIHGGWRV